MVGGPSMVIDCSCQCRGHCQERDAPVLADLVDGDDARMVDGGGGTGLAQEPLSWLTARGEAAIHHLQRDGPLQLLDSPRRKYDAHRPHCLGRGEGRE